MKKNTLLLCLLAGTLILFMPNLAFATQNADSAILTAKAYGSAFVLAFPAAGGAIGMGIAVAKALEGIAKQPEAESKIRTTLMLGMVFIETVVLYALIFAILIFFVL